MSIMFILRKYAGVEPDDREAANERAAIMEAEGGLPREQAELFARQQHGVMPDQADDQDEPDSFNFGANA
jgi:hypothetical protein